MTTQRFSFDWRRIKISCEKRGTKAHEVRRANAATTTWDKNNSEKLRLDVAKVKVIIKFVIHSLTSTRSPQRLSLKLSDFNHRRILAAHQQQQQKQQQQQQPENDGGALIHCSLLMCP